MAAEDSSDESGEGTDLERTSDATGMAREKFEEGVDRTVEEVDQGIVDLLAWLLDTETRARIYLYLRLHPDSTSDEIAEGTGLYPSTVREALAELHEEEFVGRDKRENAGAGNNPYEYEAVDPGELVRGAVGEVQRQLNTVFDLDARLRGEDGGDDPVTISVDESAIEFGEVGGAGDSEGETAETAEADD
ncbi:helix-turn-helix domain-containing protein [Halobium salinum]|uniref:Helix-turn-helix domain-containing protein n=1 Tax=Halobium salinum TaxID=1364940 RepID=A0ABD5PEW1_9EURY|nr:helix-turn-helix domain-containing protein [Halobium salinum]